MYRIFLLSLIGLLSFSSVALAQNTEWQDEPHISARLISGVTGTSGLDSVPLALEFRLEDGWKTYWRSAGDSGLPPRFHWDGSENLATANISYALPHRSEFYGVQTFVYDDDGSFLIDAILQDNNEDLQLKLRLEMLVCAELCIPANFDFELNIPSGEANQSFYNYRIERAHNKLPQTAEDAGLDLENFSLNAEDGEITLTAIIDSPDTAINAPDILIESDPYLPFAAPEINIEDGGSRAILEFTLDDSNLTIDDIEGLPARLTIIDREAETVDIRGFERDQILSFSNDATVINSNIVENPNFAAPSIIIILFTALIGGFILNLMPCVLPVLSLKLLSLANHGGGEAREVRIGFMASAAGIIFSFWVLAFAMIILGIFGHSIGWGIQFQQPIFVIFMIILLTAFAANLWGFFEVPLPRFIADHAISKTDDHGNSVLGNFITGAFATLLATPCSAPFLGVAVGFALAHGAFEIMLVFTSLGLGLSIPYLLVALFPKIATHLPKPGGWMIKLRKFLGFALALTAAWLIWVLWRGQGNIAAIALILLMLSLLVKLFNKQKNAAFIPIIIAIIYGIFLQVSPSNNNLKNIIETQDDNNWQEFSVEKLADLREEGKLIYVDVTADWCLSCKVNELRVFEDPEIIDAFETNGVTLIRADWTRRDPEISELLNEYGRYGIPFNIIYGENAPEGIILPEFLTSSAVINALDNAKKVE